MALDISINNEFLDLPTGAELEMEQENPFLQLNDELIGEFSFPFEVLATPKNMRLLGFPGTMEVRVENTGIEAVIYDNGIPSIRGKIKIEKPTIDMNNMSNGRISIYFLSGAASFWQDIKDKKLREIDAGGVRSYEWDSYGTDISGEPTGFWAHVRKVMYADPGYGTSNYDYAFFPVVNKGWSGTGTCDLMNKVYWNMPTSPVFYIPAYLGAALDNERNRIVPFPYLKYIMIQAAAYAGWTLAGSMLDDEDFCKVTMINFRAIDWTYIKKVGGSYTNAYRDPVEFNLQDHLPDITIGQLFMAIKNRMGLRYSWDRASKIMYVDLIDDIATGSVKDFTSKASPVVIKTINQQRKSYALINQFSTELGDGAPNFEVVALQGSVDEIADLPAAAETLYGFVYMVISDNNFYICQQNDGTEAWEWIFYAYNIFDYKPADSNEEITTAATTVGVEYYDAYLDLVPRIDQQGYWFGKSEDEISPGIILCFNHGVRENKVGADYPYGSSHVYDSTFTRVAQWALTFECKLAGGTIDVGLYEVFWRRILGLLNSMEDADVKLYLSRTEQMQLSFEDQLVIRNTRFFIKTAKPKVPFSGEIDLHLVRI